MNPLVLSNNAKFPRKPSVIFASEVCYFMIVFLFLNEMSYIGLPSLYRERHLNWCMHIWPLLSTLAAALTSEFNT